jgi:hypothetical protein
MAAHKFDAGLGWVRPVEHGSGICVMQVAPHRSTSTLRTERPPVTLRSILLAQDSSYRGPFIASEEMPAWRPASVETISRVELQASNWRLGADMSSGSPRKPLPSITQTNRDRE